MLDDVKYIKPQIPDSTNSIVRVDTNIYDFSAETTDTNLIEADTNNLDFDTLIKIPNDTIVHIRKDTLQKKKLNPKKKKRKKEFQNINLYPINKTFVVGSNLKQDTSKHIFCNTPNYKYYTNQYPNLITNIDTCSEFIVQTDTIKFKTNTIVRNDNTNKTLQVNKTNKNEKLQTKTYTVKEKIQQYKNNNLAKTTVPLQTDWVIGVILFSVMLLGWVRLLYRKYLTRTLNAVYNFQVSTKLFYENNNVFTRFSLILNMLFIINLSLLFTLIHHIFDLHFFKENNILLFFNILKYLLSYFVLKSTVLYFVSFIFKATKPTLEYLHNIYIYKKVLGILLLPMVILIAFSPETIKDMTIYISLFLISLMFVSRIFRAYLLSIRIKFSIFYLFLYLCTIEILPLLIISKILAS